MTEIKIGILLPRSSLYPSLAIDLLNGFKAGLNSKGVSTRFKIVYENIGFGGESSDVFAKTEKLLLQEEVSMVIAYLDHMEAAKLDPMFKSMDRLLLVLDPGGHVPTDWTMSPYRFHISLQAAFGSHLTGKLAAAEKVENPIFATSFYEGGYLQCYAYNRGLELGGTQMHGHITIPFRHEEFNITPLKHAVEQLKANAILAQLSAESGELFLKEFKSTGLHQKLKFYSSPFMLEEGWLSTIDYPFDGITGFVAWHKKLSHSANIFFMQQMKKDTGKDGNIFSMLGWEAALFVDNAGELMAIQQKSINEVIHALETKNLESPRGTLQMHSSSHYLWSPMYQVEIKEAISSNQCELIQTGEISITLDEFDAFIKDVPTGVFSKWTNTYLCI